MPSEIPSVDAFGRYLILLATFGAANKVATPEQRDGLRGAVDLMRDSDVPIADVVYRIFDVMGPDWNPVDVPDFGPWLLKLLEERRAAE